jgi:transposase
MLDCDRDRLTDAQWARLAPFMPGGCRGKRGPRTNNRLFLDALLWMARSGGRWRDLPALYGDYRTVKRRYYDWIGRGVLGAILEALNQEADLEWLCIDSIVIRAHSQAAGARKKKGGLTPRAWAAPKVG